MVKKEKESRAVHLPQPTFSADDKEKHDICQEKIKTHPHKEFLVGRWKLKLHDYDLRGQTVDKIARSLLWI
jgi:hypothetical protein